MSHSLSTDLSSGFPPVIYQDDAILVINKPAGLVVQLSYTHQEPTLEELLPDQPDLDRRGLVHRLDRDTSGVMVIARTPQAQASLYQQFKQRQTAKSYTALVWGRLADDHALIDAPIARHPVHGHKFVVMEGGKDATTEIWREQLYQFHDQYISQLKVDIHTGRTHQIRVHLAALGYPIVGDPVYGRRKDPKIVRLALHAASLTIIHPTTNQPQTFTAPLASDLTDFISTLSNPAG